MKKYFQAIIFVYSPYPYLEGIKDALCSKFRRLKIGQNCSAVCTNKDGRRNAFSIERHKVPCISRGLLSRPPSLQLSERQGLLFVKPGRKFDVRCSWPTVRGMVYAIIALIQSSVLLSPAHAHCTNWQS